MNIIPIAEAVSKAFGTEDWFRLKSRRQALQMPRKTFCFVAYKAGAKLKDIAEFIGYLDHTPVINHRDSFESLVESWPELAEKSAPVVNEFL